MTFDQWLRRWLTQHPLKEAAGQGRARFTADVMARVRALASAPAARPFGSRHDVPSTSLWMSWRVWGWGLAVSAVAAGVVLVASVGVRSPVQVARRMPAPNIETLVLAESTSHDAQWVEESLQLLDQLDEESAADADDSAPASDDEWLQELQTLDESDLASTS